MAVYKNHKNEPFFSQIKNGEKTIEIRLKKGKYKNIKIGDEIITKNRDCEDFLTSKIIQIREYDNFSNLLENEPIGKINPVTKNRKEILNCLYEFYTKEQEIKFGVLAIEISIG